MATKTADDTTGHRPNYYKVFLRKVVKLDDGSVVEGVVEVQPFDIIRALSLTFFEGSVLKYLWRKDKKSQDPLERMSDAKKVLTYAQQVLIDTKEVTGLE